MLKSKRDILKPSQKYSATADRHRYTLKHLCQVVARLAVMDINWVDPADFLLSMQCDDDFLLCWPTCAVLYFC